MPRRKFGGGDRVVGNQRKASYRGRTGTVVGYEPKGQYWVQFDDGRRECVCSYWLEKALEPPDALAEYLPKEIMPLLQ